MPGILPGILQGLQTSLAQLAKSSELPTETLQNLRKDLLLRSDDEEIVDISDGNSLTGGNTLDEESGVDDVLGTNSENNFCEKVAGITNRQPDLASYGRQDCRAGR